jgi:hypothetical protein
MSRHVAIASIDFITVSLSVGHSTRHGRDMGQPIRRAKPKQFASTEREFTEIELAGHTAGAADFPRFSLTDDQRDKISKLSGIPDMEAEAWAMIEVLITTYRNRKHHQGTALLPAKVRDELRAISKEAGKLWKRLSQLQKRLPVDYSISFPEMTALLDLGARCSLIEKDIESVLATVPSKRGPRAARDVYTLVSNLDGIRREVAGKAIRRSNKNNDASKAYITYVCRIADPNIGPGTIDKAMRHVIKRRKRRGPIAGEYAA